MLHVEMGALRTNSRSHPPASSGEARVQCLLVSTTLPKADQLMPVSNEYDEAVSCIGALHPPNETLDHCVSSITSSVFSRKELTRRFCQWMSFRGINPVTTSRGEISSVTTSLASLMT